jgi:putative sigma-54 modulation protein
MKPEITTRHFELSDSLKQRAEERVGKLQRYFDRILEARIVVSFEKNRYNAEATLVANGTPLISHAVGESEKVALEHVLDKIEVQVRRHKDRLTRVKRRTAPAGGPPVETAEEPAAEEGEEAAAGFDESDYDGLVSEDVGDFAVTMSVAMAAAQLRASRREALGFTNEMTGRPTVVFKRRDGNVGVLDIHLD